MSDDGPVNSAGEAIFRAVSVPDSADAQLFVELSSYGADLAWSSSSWAWSSPSHRWPFGVMVPANGRMNPVTAKRGKQAPYQEWVLMYRAGLTRGRMAELAGAAPKTVGYHLSVARTADPELQAPTRPLPP